MTFEQWLAEYSKSLHRAAKNSLDKFSKNLSENPRYAFEWSGAAFNAAAQESFAYTIQNWLKNQRREQISDFKNLFLKSVRNQVMISAASPTRSTSPQANILAQEDLSVRARFLEDFRWKNMNGELEGDE